MRANSKVIINHRRIRELTSATVTALEQTAEALKSDVANSQVVPFDKGTLSGEAFFVDYTSCKDGKAALVHSTPYARRLYFHPEYNFQKHEHAHAKGLWFEDWLPGGRKEDFCEKAYAALYRRIAKT